MSNQKYMADDHIYDHFIQHMKQKNEPEWVINQSLKSIKTLVKPGQITLTPTLAMVSNYTYTKMIYSLEPNTQEIFSRRQDQIIQNISDSLVNSLIRLS